MVYDIKLCINCFHCKLWKFNVRCELGFFESIELDKIKLFTPVDFDCIEWDGEV